MKKYIKSAIVILLALAMTFSIVACSKPGIVTNEDLEIAYKDGVVEGDVVFTYSPAATTSDDRAAADRFISAFEKKYKNKLTDKKAKEKVFAALIRKGFSYGAVREVLKKYIEELEYYE